MCQPDTAKTRLEGLTKEQIEDSSLWLFVESSKYIEGLVIHSSSQRGQKSSHRRCEFEGIAINARP